jgi:hypothetical protein
VEYLRQGQQEVTVLCRVWKFPDSAVFCTIENKALSICICDVCNDAVRPSECIQGCTNPGCQVVGAIRFCTMAPTICRFLVGNSFHTSDSQNFEVALRLLENCAPLYKYDLIFKTLTG